MHRRFLFLCFLLSPFFLLAQPKIQLVQFATGFDRPVDIAHCGDSRLFIVEQDGLIWILDSLGNRLPDPFLNIDPRVQSNGNEQGLLGLAFPPDYDSTGYFYVYYTRSTDGDNRLSRFSRKADNPNQADPDSEVIYFTQDDPYSNHNGGCIKFGPDGYLYISLGDGGSGGDPQDNGQKKNTFLGKILRIDVDTPSPGLNYSIPADNPFVNNPTYSPEIWDLGLRNVWRFSFDRLTGDKWLADVGQGLWEEIDFEPAGQGGFNYGWRCYEGTHAYNTNGCQPASAYIDPVFEYAHSAANGCSVTGGFVYRGSQYPDLYGRYLFADYCSGRWWYTTRNADGSFTTQVLANLSPYEYSSFGEDKNGELYVSTLSSGRIFKIRELCSPFQISTQIGQLNICTGSFSGIVEVQSTGGAGTVNYQWSNGQSGSLNVYLEAGDYIVTATDGNGCVRKDTITMTNQFPDPPTPVIDGPAELTICSGENITLSVPTDTIPYTYDWYRNGVLVQDNGGNQLVVTQPGTYYVEANAPGSLCQSAPSEQVSVLEVVIPPINVTLLDGQLILCPGDTAILGATTVPQGYTYQWLLDGNPLPNGATQQWVATEPGQYSVSISGECGTFVSAPLLIDLEIGLTPVIGLELPDSLFLVSGTECNGCQWYWNNEPIAGANDIYHVAENDGLYTLEITSPNGCKYRSAEIAVILGNTKVPPSIASFSLTPNPTHDRFVLTLELKKQENIEIALHDESGRQIFMQTQQVRSLNLPVDLHLLPAGAYWLSVKTETGTLARQVLKI
ncbi:MAG: PQQ-dependent sugar dehydrogenase [Saprospiraceae bacterium]|nr:PQQ-dependent sugar dehydrogenase [Saprospiraceae bacterium]